MKKRKIFAVLLAFILTGCQTKNAGNTPAPVFSENPASQREITQAPEPSGESADGNGEPAALSKQSIEQSLQNAQVLTEHLINRVFHEGIVERGEKISDRELFYFFTTLPQYMQNDDHPYHDAVSVTPEMQYIFLEKAVRQIAYELFGFKDWAFDDNMMDYDADAAQYASGLEFGTGANLYNCSDLQAVYLAECNRIEVSFELEGMASIDGDPGWEYLGRYLMRYQVVQETGMFLRFENVQSAN